MSIASIIRKKLHDRVARPSPFADLEQLEDEVGNGRVNRPRDVVAVKTAFERVGRLERPKSGFSGFIDRPLDGAIRRFQDDHGLRNDGFMLAQARQAPDPEPRHRIDFGVISPFEGGQRLQGYVPPDKEGRPSAESGVTIGTGFDVGQRSRADLDRLGIPARIAEKLDPYLGARGQAAERLLARRPLRVTQDEAEVIDRLGQRGIVDQISRTYNRNSRFKFEELPSAMQTVIASVGFQHGPSFRETPEFFGLATRGDLPGMVAELRDFDDPHPRRRNLEADYLEANIPRPKLKPTFPRPRLKPRS